MKIMKVIDKKVGDITYIKYRVNLPKKIGIKKYDALNRLAELEKKSDFKWSRTELIKIRNYFKNKLKL